MKLPRTVVMLGLVSLLTDLSSEMIYPLLPGFLVLLGAGAAALGTIEGAAESVSSLLKIGSGKLADRLRRRKALVLLGYSLSGVAKPLMALASAWTGLLGFRLLDRVGKGIRSSPRDALIADVTPPEQRGRAYGLQRALDNLGACLGPLAAAGLLALGLGLRQVIWCAAVPALFVLLALAFGVREAPVPPAEPQRDGAGAPPLGAGYPWFLCGVGLFTLGSATDAFLLLRLTAVGLPPENVALVWACHNLVRTLAVYVGGGLADRIDRRVLLRTGWLLHGLAFVAMAQPLPEPGLVAVVILHAGHRGFTEPTERAIVSEYAPAARRGAAFGWYHATVGLLALPSSLGLGLVWQRIGLSSAFMLGAALSLLAVLASSVAAPRRAAIS